MTERKKLTLGKPAADPASADAGPARRRPPVRGSGTAPRKRPTAQEAAEARAKRAEEPPRYESRPDSRYDNRGDARPGNRDDTRNDTRFAPDPRRGDGPPRGDGNRRPDPRREGDDRPRQQRPDGARSDQRRDGPRPPARPAYQAPPEAPAYRPGPKPPAVSSHDDGKVRLSKLMSERGLASRREADEWIDQGWVRVDGQVVEELGSRFFPDVSITVDPLARTQQAQRVTILINKPIGYVSGQAEDGYEPAVVLIKPDTRWTEDHMQLQLTRGHLRHLAPAGRLDIDSTGLLVLTQDGRVAKALIGEDSGVEKEYLVRVQLMTQPEVEDISKALPPEDLEKLRFGLELDGRQLKPAKVSWQNEQQLRFVLREGRKRQIRRMCEQVGLKVVGLKRVRMGRIALGNLPIGQWRFLRPDEQF